MKNKTIRNIFLWENFGPMHIDRCEAVSNSGQEVIGLELFRKSDTYGWKATETYNFNKITLFQNHRARGFILIRDLIFFRLKHGKSNWFLCHYDWWEILFFAFILRIFGDKVFTMADSKFDDYPRFIWKELVKRIFMLPYQGALGCGKRSKDYLRFLGIPEHKIMLEYDTLSLKRIRKLSKASPAPNGMSFKDRHFTIVARLVTKKNLHMAIHAYALYKKLDASYRLLHICGSGPLETELKDLVRSLNLEKDIIFHGFIQTEKIAETLTSTLSLILPSIEEQFGLVVIEAQAMGIPVLISEACGARDNLVRSTVNGFVFEPDNPQGLAWFMNVLANDQILWESMCQSALMSSSQGDVKMFADGVEKLINL